MSPYHCGLLGLAGCLGLYGQQNSDPGTSNAAPVSKSFFSKFIRSGSTRLVPPGPYHPPTGAQRWQIYSADTYRSAGAWIRLPLWSLIDHASEDEAEWKGADGYAKRLTTTWTAFEVRHSVRASMLAALGHEPRYLPCRCPGVFRRMGHAFTYTFFTLDRNGNKVFDVSRIISLYSAELATAGMFPGNYDVWRAMRRGNTGVSLSWTGNMFREFWPDIARKIRRK